MSQMVQIGPAIVCYEPMKEVHRESEGEKWCFGCRKRREFFFIVTAPIERFSYYGPNPAVKCGTCGLTDGDCFPGRYRTWEDD